ncbi:peptidase S9B dipeptidylpeptidase IV domain protein [Leadbetterella byssophila DSM 17132]|uniref:Peptidase S9B dipeptidylpeptidase IV domain protein n=1 Tax=Leadbetterella byssophila (strain DSM 17132 / JCM 16389 / KACC 11308 / NBRC 106382 / 4M15) TaxID=649349 RepID=E4RUF5_LEAB4|nr:S9 family peptidase [Leadbetterella byssophila]ADQ17846.1 peptidase S9B dipeptidylpeptidase IV domain protein [Leadbetterella byssophila DSM 17132]
MKKYAWAALLLPISLFAQKQALSDEALISGKLPENFLNPLPRVLKWTGDDKVIVNMKPSPSENQQNLMLNLKTGKREDFSSDLLTKTIQPRLQVTVKNGDLYLLSEGTEKRLTNDPEKVEKNPTFSPDSNYIAYTKENDLYAYHLKSGKEVRHTQDGTKTILNGYATWVYWEEIFGRGTAFRAFWWSPDSKTLAFMRFDETKTPMFPIYSSTGQYGFLEETRYPKAGGNNPTAKIGFVQPDTPGITWADFNEQDEQYFGWPKWTLDGSGLMVQWINRGNDHLKIYNVSPKNGQKKLVYEETQKEWISIDEADERLTLLDSGKEMVIISDKTGWKQLYLYSIDGKLINKITDGKYTVTRVFGIDQKEKVVYFHARGIENSARFDLYRVGLDGKNLKRLTFGDYNHRQISASPDLKYFATTYSNTRTPMAVTILDRTGKRVKELGTAKGDELDKYALNLPEIVRVKSNDGKFDLPMSIVYPEKMEAGKKYPLMISIYGGPDAGTVYDQWGWSPRSQWMAREGVIQVALDHRASGHFGKEGVAYMHRNLSKYEMEDYITQVKYLISKGIIDENKIFITGFSYGGYMTAIALTKHADVFTHGIAGGSVTDWSLYDSAYTERFMDTPQENPEGYKNGNVMNFVDRYKGKLLIVHGTMDDNVHLQNSIQLIDALQEKNKDFEMMFYPGGRHGWGGNKGVHYSNLQTKFIYKHLLEKPVPKGLLR